MVNKQTNTQKALTEFDVVAGLGLDHITQVMLDERRKVEGVTTDTNTEDTILACDEDIELVLHT